MKLRTLIVIAGLTLILGIAVVMVVSEPKNSKVCDLFAPSLESQLANITNMHITTAQDKVELSKVDGVWKVALHHGDTKYVYPANEAMITKLILSFVDMKKIEAKTNKIDFLKELELEDVNSLDAKSVFVQLTDAKNNILFDLLVGKRAGMDTVYVRRPVEHQTWLVKATIDIGKDPKAWIEKKIFGIDTARMQGAVVNLDGGQTYNVSRATKEDKDFTLQELPVGREVTSTYTINSIPNMLASLRVEDVMPKSLLKDAKKLSTIVFKTFDGLIVDADAYKLGDDTWVSFTPKIGEIVENTTPVVQDLPAVEPGKEAVAETSKTPEVKAEPKVDPKLALEDEVKKLQSQVGGDWAFQLPSYVATKFTSTVEDLLKPLETEADKNKKASADLSDMLDDE